MPPRRWRPLARTSRPSRPRTGRPRSRAITTRPSRSRASWCELRKGACADAAILACFDDTGLDAARTVFDGPVVGIGEAAFHMASLVAGSFSVVTTLQRSVPAIEHNLVRYGLASRCRSVRASEVPVLALEDTGLGRPPARLGGDRPGARRGSRRGDRARLCRHGGPRPGASPRSTVCPWSTAWPRP